MTTPNVSNFQLTVGGTIAFLGLLFSGIGVYTSLQSDIAVFKEFKGQQVSINSNTADEMRALRSEQKDSDIRMNTKLDHIIDQINSRRIR